MLLPRLSWTGLICSSLLWGGCAPQASHSETDSVSNQRLNPYKIRGEWEGWGTSLAWMGKAIGGSSSQDAYADLLFTQNSVPVQNLKLPGLGLNIVRYNIGGGGYDQDAGNDASENNPGERPWYKDIDGYWKNWYETHPSSRSFDWSRDAQQRSMMQAAVKRGANKVEFFSNSPMWWMKDSRSAAGGNLQTWNQRDFAGYLATVVDQARRQWGVNVTSVEPFNEPSSGWWNYPKAQEGCNISRDDQKQILGLLREELDRRGLGTPIAGADENTMHLARDTYETYKSAQVSVNGKNRNVADLVSRVNVHSYDGLEPFRDNGGRSSLRASLGSKNRWVSEYGDGDGGGAELAQTIMEDMSYLQPSAWVYWQMIERSSGWGLLNADFGAGTQQWDRGQPTWVYNKYYVMAHFTRFIRPGMQIIDQPDSFSIVAFDPKTRTVKFVFVNRADDERSIDWDLSDYAPADGSKFEKVLTRFDSTARWQESSGSLSGKHLQLRMDKQSIVSISLKVP